MPLSDALGALKGLGSLAGGGGLRLDNSAKSSASLEHNSPLTLITGDGNSVAPAFGTDFPSSSASTTLANVIRSLTPLFGIVVVGVLLSRWLGGKK